MSNNNKTKNMLTTVFVSLFLFLMLSFAFSGGDKGEITPVAAKDFAPSLVQEKEINKLERLSKENESKIIDLKIQLETSLNDQTNLNNKIETLKKGETIEEIVTTTAPNPKVQAEVK